MAGNIPDEKNIGIGCSGNTVGYVSKSGDTTDVGIGNSKRFISKEVKTLLDGLKIEHHKVALYAPAQNELVERFNRVTGEKLKEAVEGGFEIGYILWQIMWIIEAHHIQRPTFLPLRQCLVGR